MLSRVPKFISCLLLFSHSCFALEVAITPGNLVWELVTSTGLTGAATDIGRQKGLLAFCSEPYPDVEDGEDRVSYLQNYAFKSKLAKKYTRGGLSDDEFFAAMESLALLLKEVEGAALVVARQTLDGSDKAANCAPARIEEIQVEIARLDERLKEGKALKR